MRKEDETGPVSSTNRSDAAAAPAGGFLEFDSGRPVRTRGIRRTRRVPFLRFFGYYLLLIAVVAALAWFVPVVRRALVSPLIIPGTGASLKPQDIAMAEVATEVRTHPGLLGVLDRSAITAIVMIGTFLLSLPVAWVYMFTRRLRYDASLVQSILILPLVIAGVVLIVKNSLALAFSLAGIVAAVRFRNTLKDPRDAVFVFLVLGLGVATGVQALDVGLVISFAFNTLVLLLWKTSLDEIYGAAGRGHAVLGVGDPSVFLATDAQVRERIRERTRNSMKGLDAEGVLLIHTPDTEAALRGAELSLTEFARTWRHISTEAIPFAPGINTLVELVEFKKKKGPVELLGELEDRWSAVILGAEYIPFQAHDDED